VGQGWRLVAGGSSKPSAWALAQEVIVQRNLFRLKYLFAKSPAWLAHWIRAALAEGQKMALREMADGGPR
jgi:hypothetical protein